MHNIVKNIERDKNIFLQQIQGQSRIKNLGCTMHIMIGITAELTAAFFQNNYRINFGKLTVRKRKVLCRSFMSGSGILTHYQFRGIAGRPLPRKGIGGLLNLHVTERT